MSIIHAIILGLLQGLTEFLPVSSSGHLTLVPQIFGWEELDPSIEKTFDVALHAGTLIGALIYLRKDVTQIIVSFFRGLRTRHLDKYAKLGVLLLVSSIPGALLGAALESWISKTLDKPALVASALLIGAIILYVCDKNKGTKTEDEFSFSTAVITGASQALALQPGVSRSGITMSALRMQGFSRATSARLSFLMLLPIVAGAALYTGTKTMLGDGIPSDLVTPMIVGVITSAITGWLAVFWLLKLVQTKTFTVFVIYRIVIAILIFAWIIF